MSGREGMTSARLVMKLSVTSTAPERYPATSPMITAARVASKPADRPTSNEIRVP